MILLMVLMTLVNNVHDLNYFCNVTRKTT